MKYLFLIFAFFLSVSCSSVPSEDLSSMSIIEQFKEAEDFYKKGLLVQAESRYRALLATNPRMYDAWLRLGNIHARTGQLEAAILAFQKCIEISPERVNGWHNLSLTRVMQATEVAKEGLGVIDSKDSDRKELEKMFEGLIYFNKI